MKTMIIFFLLHPFKLRFYFQNYSVQHLHLKIICYFKFQIAFLKNFIEIIIQIVSEAFENFILSDFEVFRSCLREFYKDLPCQILTNFKFLALSVSQNKTFLKFRTSVLTVCSVGNLKYNLRR